MTTEMSRAAKKTAWIPVKQLSVVWCQSQRAFNAAHAKTIADDFDPDMFGIIAVTLPNGEGIYHIVDGQHRKDAVQQLYGEDEKVPCHVLDASDPARAAEIFDKINTARKSPRPIDRFLVRVTARYKVESAVARIVTLAGYKVSSASATGCIGCVDALVSIYNRHSPDVLEDSLSMIHETFGPDPHAVAATLVRGYADFIATFAHAFDRDRLVAVIKKHFSPGQLLAAGKTAGEMNRESLSRGVAYVLRTQYNRKLKGRQLSEAVPPARAHAEPRHAKENATA